jgi:membrane protease YdiL (CAAX protease family)
MEDQGATLATSQNSNIVVVTRKEGFIALIIGIIHLLVFPLTLVGVGQYFGLAEASAMTLLIINFVWTFAIAVALIVFLGDFLKRSWTAFRDSNKGKIVLLLLLGFVAIYIGNIIISLIVMPALGLNIMDGDTINLQTSLTAASPLLMLLMAGFLAPVVEETLFRGALFGRLHTKSHILAYVVSIVLFAVAHVWQFAIADPTQWVRALSWIPMGIGFAFVYRRSGNVFTSMTLHMLFNIIAVIAQFMLTAIT